MTSLTALSVQFATAAPNRPDEAQIRGWALAALDGAAGELVIRLVDEAEAAALNHRFRGQPKPTNVLAFAGDGTTIGDDHARYLGDIVICAGVVAREAAEQGIPLAAHWAHVVVHGCLHLLGYDHEANDEAARMEARERQLLAALGFDDPYARL